MEELVVSTKLIQAIHNLCQGLDPYQPLTEKQKMALTKLRITDHSNPFEITNRLLLLLDVLEEKQKKSHIKTLQ